MTAIAWAKVILDIGANEAAKIHKEVNTEGIDEDLLCIISPEEGDYYCISINGDMKHLPTGVPLFLSEAEKEVLNHAVVSSASQIGSTAAKSAAELEAERIGKE